MLCPNCERPNRDGAKFCDECGFPLTGAIARAAAATGVDVPPVGETSDLNTTVTASEDVPAEAVAEPESAPESQLADADEAQAVVEEAADEGSSASDAAAPVDENAETSGDADVTKAIDLNLGGLDEEAGVYGESVLDADYQAPEPNWRDGHTMQMPRVDSDEQPRSRDFLASSTTEQKRGGKTAVIIVIAVILVAAAVVFATYQMQLWGGKSVPDVHGMTEADATSVLEDSGFKVRALQVKSDDTEGLVLISDPAAGSRADEGTEIVVHIATSRAIPDVVGKTQSEAEAALDGEGYENVTYEKERSDAQEGTVLSITPAPGTRSKSTVAVVVKVAEPYVVPDTASLSQDGAIAAVQDAGLGYAISYVDTQDYPEGTVLGTDPAAGTKVKSDTVVSINVARARGAQLMELTRGLLAPGYELNLGGTNYIVNSLNSVNYLGNDQVAFTVTARPYTVFFGVYVEGDLQQVSGVVTWTADNGVDSIS